MLWRNYLKLSLLIRILKKNSIQSIIEEFNFLSKIRNELIINMSFAFQDRENIYFILDYLPGGDLRFQFNTKIKFNEEQAKFLICCIILGLETCHKNGYIHRDLKPENLVFDENGYLKLTDFGISKIWKPNNFIDNSGTPGYMSPEVICKKNHSYSTDFFALGIILHEFIKGYRPYRGRNKKEILDGILNKQAYLKKEINWSDDAINFCNRLIKRRPNERLGRLGIWELKNHPWLKSINWDDLSKYKIKPKFIPNLKIKNYDKKYVNQKDEPNKIEDYTKLKNKKFQKNFNDIYYNFNNQKNYWDSISNKKTNVTFSLMN